RIPAGAGRGPARARGSRPGAQPPPQLAVPGAPVPVAATGRALRVGAPARLIRRWGGGRLAVRAWIAHAWSNLMKILIVENERRVAQFIAQALNEQSYTTGMAASCRAARDALAESPYDAIVLDLGLDDGDGLDLLSEWRRHGFNEPVLIL